MTICTGGKNVLIIGPSRSGTTLLGAGLGSHPGARYAGDIAMWERKWGKLVNDSRTTAIFSKHFGAAGFTPETITPPLPWRPCSRTAPQTSQMRAYLTDLLTQPQPPALVGKITFETMPMDHALWAPICDLDLAFIFIYRRNLLASFVSWKLARKSRIWDLRPGSLGWALSRETIALDPHETSQYFFYIQAHLDHWTPKIKELGGTIVEYEEMTSDWPGTTGRLFDELGWPVIKARKKLKKRTRSDLAQVISNFVELREYFLGSQWEALFCHAG